MSKTLMTPSPVRLPSTWIWPKSVGAPAPLNSEAHSYRLAAYSPDATSLNAPGSMSPPSVLGAPMKTGKAHGQKIGHRADLL